MGRDQRARVACEEMQTKLLVEDACCSSSSAWLKNPWSPRVGGFFKCVRINFWHRENFIHAALGQKSPCFKYLREVPVTGSCAEKVGCSPVKRPAEVKAGGNWALYKSVTPSNVTSSDHCFLICHLWVSMALLCLNELYLKCFPSKGLVAAVMFLWKLLPSPLRLCKTSWRWLWRNIFSNKLLISTFSLANIT